MECTFQDAASQCPLAAKGSFRGSDRIDLYSPTKRMSVISEGIPNRIGGPQYPVPRLT